MVSGRGSDEDKSALRAPPRGTLPASGFGAPGTAKGLSHEDKHDEDDVRGDIAVVPDAGRAEHRNDHSGVAPRPQTLQPVQPEEGEENDADHIGAITDGRVEKEIDVRYHDREDDRDDPPVKPFDAHVEHKPNSSLDPPGSLGYLSQP